MKRSLAFFLVLCLMATVFAACGKKTEYDDIDRITADSGKDAEMEFNYDIPINEDLDYDNYELSEFIELPDYKNFELECYQRATDDAAIDHQIYNLLLSVAEKTDVTDRSVQEGDLVTVKFEGVYYGTDDALLKSEGQAVTVGKNDLGISGFDEALSGMSIGETKTVDLVLPQNYVRYELSGTKGTFTLTVLKIQTADLPELTPSVIRSFDLEENVTDEASLRYFIKVWLDQENSLEKQDELYDRLVRETKLISYPKKAYDYYADLFDANTEAMAKARGIELEAYKLSEYATEKDYDAARDADAGQKVFKDMIIYALKAEHGAEMTKARYNEALKYYFDNEAKGLGITDPDEFYEKMGYSVYKGELTYLVLEAAIK